MKFLAFKEYKHYQLNVANLLFFFFIPWAIVCKKKNQIILYNTASYRVPLSEV